jgi:cytochrome c oxidase subunit I+III
MPDNGVRPGLHWLWIALAGLLASFVLVELAGRALARPVRNAAVPLLLGGSFAAFAFAFGIDLWSLLATGLDPKANAYGATALTVVALTGALVAALALMVGYVLVRWATGRLHARRRAAFDVTRQLLLYALAQAAAGLLLVRGFPLVAA